MTNNLLINCRNSRRRDKRVTWGFFLSLINPTRVWQFLYKPVTQCGGLTMSDLPNILGGFYIQIQNNCYFKKNGCKTFLFFCLLLACFLSLCAFSLSYLPFHLYNTIPFLQSFVFHLCCFSLCMLCLCFLSLPSFCSFQYYLLARFHFLLPYRRYKATTDFNVAWREYGISEGNI